MYKVLIVDDDKVSRYILKRYSNWSKFNFIIENEACDGKEGLNKLASNKFDLVITDIKMPGMNGLEFLGEIKGSALNNNVCVILLSTYNDFEFAKQGLRLGAFDYITKPVNDEMLDEALKRAEAYLNKTAIEEEKKQLEKNLLPYYPQSSVNVLKTLIFNGDNEAICKAEQIFEEMYAITEENLLQAELAFNNLLIKLKEEITKAWPWIENFQDIIPENLCSSMKSIEEIKAVVIDEIRKMVELIRKFELHQVDSLVKITCEYILQHVEEDITLEIIAQKVNANKDYVGKLFKQATGYNFKQYVTKVKMEHAKYLIKLDYYKNYEISEKLGYSTVDYFTRIFKSYTGYTPMEYRKSI